MYTLHSIVYTLHCIVYIAYSVHNIRYMQHDVQWCTLMRRTHTHTRCTLYIYHTVGVIDRVTNILGHSLYAVHSTGYVWQRTLYVVLGTINKVHGTLYAVQCTGYVWQLTRYNDQSTWYTVQCTMPSQSTSTSPIVRFIVQYMVYSMHYTLYTIHCIVYSV